VASRVFVNDGEVVFVHSSSYAADGQYQWQKPEEQIDIETPWEA